jgi:chitosanase
MEVIEVYGRMRPNNVLSVFIPTLKDRKGTASTEGLEGLPAAWKEATADPLFRQAQDRLSDKLYYNPAMQEVNALHLRSIASSQTRSI